MKKGKIIIISAPSGCGKSTIINEIVKDSSLELGFSISATSRKPREGEQEGVNYYYLTLEQFKDAIANDELVEYEEVYAGCFYGTLKKEVQRIQECGKNVILDIDVKGAVNVKKLYGDTALSIFIQPPTIETLHQRLLSRGTETEEAINMRVEKASYELSFASQFDKVVINDVLETAVEEVHTIITDFINK